LLLYSTVDHWQNHYKPNDKLLAAVVMHFSHVM